MSITHIAEKPHKHKHHGNNGKHKGYQKGKHNPHKVSHHKPKKVVNHRTRGRNHHSRRPPGNGPAPRVSKNTPSKSSYSRREYNKCKVIIKPVKSTVRVVEKRVPRTKTITEKVLYGTGLIVSIATFAAVLMLLIGFAIGWARRKKNEEKFLNSVVDKE
jgi:hypothetical protein